MGHIAYFGHNKSLCQKMCSVIFMYLLNPNFRQKIKKVMSQSCENGVTDRWTERRMDEQTELNFIVPSSRAGVPMMAPFAIFNLLV